MGETFYHLLRRQGVSRRSFLKFCSLTAASMGLSPAQAQQMAAALQTKPRLPVVWLHGLECTCCTESFIRSAHPLAKDAILSMISLDYDDTIMAAAGYQAEAALEDTIAKYKGNYILAVEGNPPLNEDGMFCLPGGKPFVEKVRHVAKDAKAVIAWGSCASWGCVQAAKPNPTQAVPIDRVIKDKPIIKRARYLKPAYSFRSGYGYSNIMFMAAGEVVPAVTGKPWKDFIKERIFDPLGMKTSNIGTTDLKNYANVAAAHYVYGDGKTEIVPYTTSDKIGGASSINSNVMEMMQWIKLLLNNGVFDNQRILSEDSIQEMWSSHTVNRVTASTKKLFPTTHFMNYGLGWGLSDYHGYKVIAHGGGLDGMISRVVLVPEIKLGLVILTNSINGLPNALGYKIIDTYLGVKSKDWSRIYLEKYQESVKKEMQHGMDITKIHEKGTTGEVKLEDYAGLYGGPMYGDAKVTLQEGKLVLELLPAPVFISDLTHLHYDTFVLKFRNTFSFVPHGTGTVQFIRDKQGDVVEMKLDIPNGDFWFDELEFKKKKTQ